MKIIILKNLKHRKKLNTSLLVGQCLQNLHLMKNKINLIITEEKTVLKNCVKKLKECAMKIVNNEKKEMIPLTKEENKYIKIKRHAIYAKKIEKVY